MKSNCYICGRFVGKDGNHDVEYDDYTGGYEQGYPTCGKHTKLDPVPETPIQEVL